MVVIDALSKYFDVSSKNTVVSWRQYHLILLETWQVNISFLRHGRCTLKNATIKRLLAMTLYWLKYLPMAHPCTNLRSGPRLSSFPVK